MPARVLLIADPKMLPALAAGLREGGRFEVVTAPSPEAAQELAAEPLQAAILFYGTSLWTLPAALQALKPLRDKGAHVVAVLQKAQVGLRDECFRAGASDAFFMPIPKEQFVGRLSASLGLAYGESDGLPASVQVASRSTPAGMPAATVTTAGVHGDASIPFEAGHTVRLSWKANEEAFASWGLVVRSAPAQVRFAGLTPEEDSRLRSWLKASLPASGAAISTASMPSAHATPSAMFSARPRSFLPCVVREIRTMRSSSVSRARRSSPAASRRLRSGVMVPESRYSRSPMSLTVSPSPSQSTRRTRYWGYVTPSGASSGPYA